MSTFAQVASPKAATALIAVAAGLVAPSWAAGATFGSPTPVTGFGNQPALAQIQSAALSADGLSAIVGTSSNTNNRRAAAAFGTATAPPAAARSFGSSGAYDEAFAANDNGDVAITWSVGHKAYLTTCHAGKCRPTTAVGSSRLKPESTVAVQPGMARTIVLWRGRTSSGADRLQWRITTNGKLGATHTLGEFGDEPRIATDDSGRAVAIWLADGRSGRRGLRTASRHVGEFVKPSTLTPVRGGDPAVVASEGGQFVAGWLSAPNGLDPEGPLGTVQVSTRTRSTAFSSPQSLGSGSTLSLSSSPDGNVVLATDRHATPTGVVVSVGRKAPGKPFGALVDVAPAQFISDAYPATAASGDGGRALVSWASGTDPGSTTAPSGVYAAIAEPSAEFSAPQLLGGASVATLPEPTGAAITGTGALVAWAGPQGGQVALAR
jgi:hypothetical protein